MKKKGIINSFRTSIFFIVFQVVVLFLFSQPAFAFKPGRERGHAGMTRKGMQAIKYTAKDGSVWEFSDKAILQAKKGNKIVDLGAEALVAKAHFDDELLPEGSQRLIDFKDDVITLLKENPPNADLARFIMGRALHTLQDFYAHSNWVNNPGPSNTTFNPKLGMDKIHRLSTEEPTCIDDFCDCTLTGKGLTNITTGYFHLFWPEPPDGKCSHGKLPMTGIHKDTHDRDFFNIAEDCAIGGTTDLINQIIDKISYDEEIVRAFLDVRGSIGFVIDDTGSMEEEINGVKNAVANIINLVKDNPDLKPDKYILVRFNDPSVGSAFVTQSADTLLGALNAISVYGGDDCPEMSMTGLMRALDVSTTKGSLHLFTDASSKDGYLVGNIVAKAQEKKIKIYAALTGTCSPVDQAYERITSETGGQLVWLDQYDDIENYFAIVEPELSGDLQSIIIAQDVLTGTPASFTFPVDSTMSTLIASINMDIIGVIRLFRPNGTEVNATDTDVEITDLLNGRIISLNKPSAGNWSLTVEGGSNVDFSVSIMGNSNINFEEFEFVEYKEYRPTIGGFIRIDGQPVASAEHTAMAILFGPYSDTNFSLISESGGHIQNIDLSLGHEEADVDEFVGSFNLPSDRFRVIARGSDPNGTEFLRTFPTVYLGQSVKVEVSEADAEMIAGADFTALFKLTNLGMEDTFNITAADSYGLVSDVSDNIITIDEGESKEIEVVLSIPPIPPTDIVTLTVVAQSTTNTTIENSALVSRYIVDDFDGDGLSNKTEMGVTEDDINYDGNGDGQPDYRQANVASLFTEDYNSYVTVEITGNGIFLNVNSISNPSPSDSSEDVEFPFGFFDFTITGLNSGDSTSLVYHLSSSTNQFYNYGSSPTNPISHWYKFSSNGVNGALFDNNNVILTYVDGDRGDNDLIENGTISSVGGPAIEEKKEAIKPPPRLFPWPGMFQGALGWPSFPIAGGMPGGLPFPGVSHYPPGISRPSFVGMFPSFAFPGSMYPAWTTGINFRFNFPQMGIFSPLGSTWTGFYWLGFPSENLYQTGWFLPSL